MRILLLVYLGLVIATVLPKTGRADDVKSAEVIVLSTLHQFHEQIEGYSFDDLSRIIEQLRPDVLAVELTLADVESRRDQSTKQEYQRSVFPLLEKHSYVIVPLEPSQPLFDEIVSLFRNAQKELSEQNPDAAEAFGLYVDTLYEMLREQWTSPASVNSQATDILFESKHRFQSTIFGPMEDQAWERWNRHFLHQILLAADANPGTRILVLVGAEHAYWLRAHLRLSEVSLLDAEQLLDGS